MLFAIGAALWPILFGETFWTVTTTENAFGGSGTNITTQNWHWPMWVAYKWFFHSLWGATPAKFLLRIRVLDESGKHRIGFLRGLFRALGSELSTFILFIGHIIAGIRSDKRALHDLIAQTYPVILDRKHIDRVESDDPWKPQ